MSQALRVRKIWLPWAVCIALMLWLTNAMLPESWEISGFAAQGSDQTRVPTITIDRPPVRTIKDPNPSFSAVAVNSENNMLVVADENLFRIVEYDRRDNTPSQARFTEPKRVISGTNTMAEMMCGVYIDPKTLEIYALNGDTQNWMPVFSTDARGNARPSRYLRVPGHPFQMAVHEERQQIYMVIQSDNKIQVYRKQAAGEEKPLRTIEGNDTQLEDPHGIAIDTKNNVFFVSNFGNSRIRTDASKDKSYGKFEPPSITVYSLDAVGNVKPLRIIEGPRTLMNWPSHMAFDDQRQELFVANDADSSILVFRAADQGNAAPIRVISGSKTGIRHAPGIALDSKLGELYVASIGTPTVTVFPETANGNVAPSRTIRAAAAGAEGLMIGNPGGVTYDTKRDQILVLN